jgi:hypothetical protein
MAGCKHDCDTPARFPRAIFNRPALPEIDYRIGSYSSMREYLLDQLNKSVILSDWTHRGADDPGIAILEGAALVGDVLTFYQQLYANQAFLRTADWRESVSELVQLTGYRLAPGVGGEATFALKVKGEDKVSVPAGFGFKAQLEDQDKPDEFESGKTITAWPHLSQFNLYCPPRPPVNIATGLNRLELKAVGDAKDIDTLASLEINSGDRLMLVPDATMYDVTGASYSVQARSEIVIVKQVEQLLDRIVIHLEGELTVDRGNSVKAYLIDRTFHHFGYNAASLLNKYNGVEIEQQPTDFERDIYGTHSGSNYYSRLTRTEIPLEQEVKDLALGSKLICQGLTSFDDDTGSSEISRSDQRFTVVKTIEEIKTNTLKWGHTEASTSVLIINSKLIANDDIAYESADIRQMLFHETISPELTLAAPTDWHGGDFSEARLQFYGTYSQLTALTQRKLMLVDDDTGQIQRVRVTDTLDDFKRALAGSDKDEQHDWMWDISLDVLPAFKREQFWPGTPKITVYGNLIEATQGKSEKQAVLGSGDNRQTFQTFKLPRAPLTYLLDESQTPAQVPELQVYVDNILWQRVDNFFDRKQDAQVYVVREDEEGNSWIQFGDGKNGSRLPSGNNNVVALYRSGIGASGELKADSKPQATGKLKPLDKVYLPAEVVGGEQAETEVTAREAAPARLQSLDRMVSLADYEAETLAIPGVIKVRADWTAPSGTPLVRMVILTESGTQPALNKVRNTLKTYNRCRGAARFPILCVAGNLHYIALQVRAAYAANRRVEDIQSAIETALGIQTVDDEGNHLGLFSLAQRRFGQNVHVSQVIAAIQQVEGVQWVEVDALQALEMGTPIETDPEQLTLPAVLQRKPLVQCDATRVLVLHEQHFSVNLILDESKRECEA